LLLDVLRLRAGGNQCIGRVVEIELRAVIVLHQRLLAFDVALLQVHALLGKIEHVTVDLDVGNKIVIGDAGLGELRFGFFQRMTERSGVDLEQLVAVLDDLTFLDDDLLDFAGDIRGHQHFLRADIGVISADVTAAIEIEGEAGNRDDERQHNQEQHAAIAAQARHQAAARIGAGFLGGLAAVDFLLGLELENLISHSVAPYALVPLRCSGSRTARFP
jgi:hypothetical protein